MKMPPQGPQEFVPVEAEPSHGERWRNDAFRVYAAQFPAHKTCLRHQHVRNTIYICVDGMNVIEQPLHQEPRPLQVPQGHLLWRDHRKFPLIHVVTSTDRPLQVVAVEILAEQIALDNTDLPCHALTGLTCLEDTKEFRAYRIRLGQSKEQDESNPTAVELTLPTRGVLVSLTRGPVVLEQSGNDKLKSASKMVQQGEDFELTSGVLTMQLVDQQHESAMHEFILIEVF